MSTIAYLLHLLIVAVYLIAPLGALTMDVHWTRRRGRSAPSAAFIATLCAGTAMGTTVAVAYSVVAGVRPNIMQAVLASYFASGLLIVLKLLDFGLRIALRSGFRFKRPILQRLQLVILSSLRVGILFGVGLPYIIVAGLTYRPKVVSKDNPGNSLGLKFTSVEFSATDGVPLSAWWIPAASKGPRDRHETIVICPGPGTGKSSALPLVAAFAPYGYNVLLFDFRAHGTSGGQITSFGDLERRDVLGAINWIGQNHQPEARKIFGVGVETGGAALIGAAADPTPAGQALNAIAIYGGFENFSALARSVVSDDFLNPISWLVSEVGMPLASMQTGTDLAHFSPAHDIQAIWPRPVFILQGEKDETFPFDLGRRLFESAAEPKQRRWVSDATNSQLLNDQPTSKAVREFFQTAVPTPVI